MKTVSEIKKDLEAATDLLFQRGYELGFNQAAEDLEELSDQKHNEGFPIASEILRWAAKELRGENA